MIQRQKTIEGTQPPLVDFEKFRAALRQVSLPSRKGSVVRVSGLTVESDGPQVGIGELCEIEAGSGQKISAEVISFRDGHVVLMPLAEIEGIRPGNSVTASSSAKYLRLDESALGRVLDGLGKPIDGKGPLAGRHKLAMDRAAIPPLSRPKISEPLSLGIRSIDGVLTCGRGQRVGIFAGSGVGKSLLLGEIANGSEADVNVVALVGERGREVREFLEDNLGARGLGRSVVVVATSDAPAIQRVRAAFVAATIAEYFRDEGKNVLFMMDSLTRFAQAQREIGLAAGEPPATKGYCPSVFAMMPKLIERLGNGVRGSITGILTVLVEGDDLGDPVADSARSLLDGHIVLSRKLAERGHYPAVDILQSVSRLMNAIVPAEHREAAQKLREIYATYIDAEDLISIGALAPGSNRQIDGAVAMIDRIRQFLVQPAGRRSTFGETVEAIKAINRSWNELLGDTGLQKAAGRGEGGR